MTFSPVGVVSFMGVGFVVCSDLLLAVAFDVEGLLFLEVTVFLLAVEVDGEAEGG